MTLPIACAQLACAPFDPRSNLAKAEHFLREAARQGARLILLPEFLTTGYTYDRRLHDFAEPIGGPTTRWMQRRSRQLNCWVGAGMIERAHDGLFDTFLLTGPAGQVLSYRKQYPAFFERLYFDRGRTIGIFDTALGRLGVMICWDMVHFRLSRAMAGRIDLLLICSAWPDVRKGNLPLHPLQGWLSRQPVQRPPRLARKLDVAVAYCNMAGDFVTAVPGLGLTYRSEYAGSSSITDRHGATLAAAGQEETLVLAEVPLQRYRHRRMAV